MEAAKSLVGIFLSLIGILFFFNNKNMGKGAYNFYRKFYTAKNLTIMFKILGAFLFIIGLVVAFSE